MFTKARIGWIVLTLLVAIVPLAARAGMCHRRAGHCGRCARPFNACGCAQPFCGMCQMTPASCGCQPAMQTEIVPQTTTIYRQEQFTTMQPVTRTEIRQQAQVVDVPVTTCKQVTVDEGTYQTVWVPRLTTKMVSETSIQKQVRYQEVPYQVVQQVPVVQTRVVPQQVTTYVQRSTLAFDNGHLGHNHGIVSLTPSVVAMGTPSLSYEPIASDATASIASTPDPYSPAPIAHDHPDLVQTPPVAPSTAAAQPEASSGTWSKVPTRQAEDPKVELQAYEVPVRQVSAPTAPARRAPFPTAATVWQAQSAFSRN
ncbi:hypothetical protein SH661x_001910 [Planctomicrobium sp. SH661]|uniref:hypothetical protein n=1 Tax=Planctomicrobium sp. SH661 TaxID=3448124 RepID=UPI003F5B1B15